MSLEEDESQARAAPSGMPAPPASEQAPGQPHNPAAHVGAGLQQQQQQQVHAQAEVQQAEVEQGQRQQQQEEQARQEQQVQQEEQAQRPGDASDDEDASSEVGLGVHECVCGKCAGVREVGSRVSGCTGCKFKLTGLPTEGLAADDPDRAVGVSQAQTLLSL